MTLKIPKVTIGLIVHDGCQKYLPYSIPDLLKQDYPAVEFLIRDHSEKGAVSRWLRENLPETFEKARVTQGENLLHSGGHNALIGQMTGDYYFCLSNDMRYPPDFVSEAVAAMEKPENAGFGSATVKLMRWDFERNEKTNTIDSAGIGIRRTHHFPDTGQGEEDRGQYDGRRAVFGGSGGCLILRKSALEKIRYRDEYFDALLHYKNDVDLAYRLQWAGLPCLFLPRIKVWHDRQTSHKKSRWMKENSLFGHLVTLQKNFDPRFSWNVKMLTKLYNGAKFVYFLLREPSVLKQVSEVKKHAEEIEAKKKAIIKRVSPALIEKLMI